MGVPDAMPHGTDPAVAAAILDSIPHPVAILDNEGTIVAVNGAWRRHSDRHDPSGGRELAAGGNYLQVCRDSADADCRNASEVYWGLRMVLDDVVAVYSFEYSHISPTEKHSFLLTAARIEHGRRGAVLIHTDVTAGQRHDEARLNALAQIDLLTRLPTRTLLPD